MKWSTLAAEKGHDLAQYGLGFMYENGKKLRDSAVKRMTPSQIEKAQDLARECVAKNYKGC